MFKNSISSFRSCNFQFYVRPADSQILWTSISRFFNYFKLFQLFFFYFLFLLFIFYCSIIFIVWGIGKRTYYCRRRVNSHWRQLYYIQIFKSNNVQVKFTTELSRWTIYVVWNLFFHYVLMFSIECCRVQGLCSLP